MADMTPEEREAFYDEHIAPRLAELGQTCQSNGLSLVAIAEWAPGETGITGAIHADAGFTVRLTQAAAHSRGNVDSLISAIIRLAEKNGHSSIYLSQLGVPCGGRVQQDNQKPTDGTAGS